VNNLTLLLGPSGIGKTSVIKKLMRSVPSIRCVVLDNIVHKHARENGLIDKKDNLNALIKALDHDRSRLFEYGLLALEEYQHQFTDKAIVVDVGTGFLDAKESMAWVIDKPSIAITACSAIAYERFHHARKLDISYEQYMTTQFSSARNAIYNSAAIVIKSDQLDEQESATRFAFSLIAMLDNKFQAVAMNEWLTANA